MRLFGVILLIASALASTPRTVPAVDPLPAFPRVVFWAWERPEKMPFLDPKAAGVAMLGGTIRAGVCHSRMQPLRLPAETPILVTVRIESAGAALPAVADAARCAVSWALMPGTRALQIDFDARVSERGWYRELLTELRRRLPAQVALTMTALASWCEQDGWIRDLPVAEAVPMLFRMGPGEVWNRRDFDVPVCRTSVGVATDELPAKIPSGRRVYFFHPSRWTEDDYHAAWKAVRSYQ